MPYKLRKSKGKFCVFTEGTGENKGCSDSKAMAVKHMRALYAAESASTKELSADEIDGLVKEALEEFDEKSYDEMPAEYVPGSYSAVSYAELDSLRDAAETQMKLSNLIGDFPLLVSNIMTSYEIEDKSAAVTALANELAARLQTIDSDEESEDKSMNFTEDEGFLKRVVNKLKEVFGITTPDNEFEPMTIWKDKSGNWKWLARYSNSFRDRDLPPEIISAGSHRKFVEKVDKGLVPLPELWLWHVKDWKIGQADWVEFDEVDDNTGFALAGGHFLPGFEHVAVWLSKRNDVLVSHGMPEKSISRDSSDPSIITEHVTREISPLPSWAAANTLTGFMSFKEVDMAIPSEKRDMLISEWKMPPELLAVIEGANQKDAKKAIEDGIETKESEPVEEPKPETPEAETAQADDSADAAKKESAETPVVPAAEAPVDTFGKNEILEALAHVLAKIDVVEQKVDLASKEVDQLKQAREAELQEVVKNSTNASLLSMLTGRAVGNSAAQLDNDDGLAKSKPKETDPGTQVLTGIPFIDGMLAPTQK